VSGSNTGRRLATAIDVGVRADRVEVRLSDRRLLHLRVSDFPFLRDATPDERATCLVDEHGTVLWWPRLREGISVAGLIGVAESELEEFAGIR
jgi:hypothetical protein